MKFFFNFTYITINVMASVIASDFDLPLNVDFGAVMMGQTLQREVQGHNVSGKTLTFKSIRSTCGCTIGTPLKLSVRHDETLPIVVSLNTHQKLGPVSKTLTLFFKESEQRFNIVVSANVLAPMKIHEAMNSKAIFKGDCRLCHVDPGRGKSGQALYLSSCALCHGSLRQGGPSAPALKAGESISQRRLALENGLGNMPAFSADQGGPLTQHQIDSLLVYLDKKPEPVLEVHPLLIYEQLCSHCHGDQRMGGIGPPLVGEEFKKLKPDVLKAILMEGLGHPSMPAWHESKGGPLNNKQIDRLLQFLTQD